MSGPLTFEERICKCGLRFDALTIWPDDAPCDVCARKAFNDRLAAINAGRSYTVESIGGMCPTQAEGRLADGRPYYFRARHGTWTLRVGTPTDAVDFTDWLGDGEFVASGDDPTHGAMTDEAVLAHIDAFVAEEPTP